MRKRTRGKTLECGPRAAEEQTEDGREELRTMLKTRIKESMFEKV